jgi:tripartite-type tricarboxylate transporter receptor subunit TctC
MPTAGEAGLPDVQLTTWTGFYAPKNTPAEIVQSIYRDIAKVATMPEVLERLKNIGGVPKLMTPEDFDAFTRSEKERWGRIIQRANIKVE